MGVVRDDGGQSLTLEGLASEEVWLAVEQRESFLLM